MYVTSYMFFFYNDTAPTDIYTLSLHDALPISPRGPRRRHHDGLGRHLAGAVRHTAGQMATDRKSTRLNSSHRTISYAVFCLKKKKKKQKQTSTDALQRPTLNEEVNE